MEKMLSSMNKIPKDKLLHSFYGTLLFLMIVPIDILLSLTWALSLYIVIVVAVLKEVYDYFHKNHTAYFWDIVATISIPILLYLEWRVL